MSETARVPNSRASTMIVRTRSRGRPTGGTLGAELAQPVRPDLGVPALVAGDRPERLAPGAGSRSIEASAS